jgi:hypothetical protein
VEALLAPRAFEAAPQERKVNIVDISGQMAGWALDFHVLKSSFVTIVLR